MLVSQDVDTFSPEKDGHGYPRPQFRREAWIPLNGMWDFKLDPQSELTQPDKVTWDQRIKVPFAPETLCSGVGVATFHQTCWYRNVVSAPKLRPGDRLLLHFGAVDYKATVWVNKLFAIQHSGGYTPFSVDITDHIRHTDRIEIVVRAEDDPHDLAKPRGKQDWRLEPHSIWYPRTSGIWQSVWLEPVPPVRIGKLRWTSNLTRGRSN